jgi:hypothetical protein
VTEIPSVPDAYDEYLYWARIMAAPYGPLTRRLGSYSITRAYEQARQAWIDAEWQVNCASYQWLRGFPITDRIAREAPHLWWQMHTGVLAFIYESRHSGEWPQWVPGKALALRPKGVIA